MKAEHTLMGQGFLIIAFGVAALTAGDDLMRRSGSYAMAAGVVTIGFSAWAIRRGAWTTSPPPAPLQRRCVSTSIAHACPKCASQDTRPLTAVETTAFYGYDRLVFVRPRACENCGHAFEGDSKLGRAVLATVIVVGSILSVAALSFAVIAPVLSWRQQPFLAENFALTSLGAVAALWAMGVTLMRSGRALKRLACPAPNSVHTTLADSAQRAGDSTSSSDHEFPIICPTWTGS